MATPNTGIPYVPEGTLDPAAGLNLALNHIDGLLQAAVIGTENDPPVTPPDGSQYIVGVGTGDWVGQDDNVARYVAEGDFWQFYQAGTEVRLLLDDSDLSLKAYDGTSGWVTIGGLSDAPSDGQTYGRKDGGWVVVTGGGGGVPAVVSEAGTALTANAANAGNYTRFTNAGVKTYTFDGAETYTTGDEYHGRNVGAGDLTITVAGTMSINAPAGGTLVVPEGGTFTVKIVAPDEADLFGVTVAA